MAVATHLVPAVGGRLRQACTNAAPRAERALVTKHSDVWLVGGASLAVWGALAALTPLRDVLPSVDFQLRNLAATAASLALIVNYPHFMASYRLAYGRGIDYVSARWFSLIVVPGALLILLVLGYVTYDRPMTIAGLTVRDFGRQLSGGLVNLMFFTVGWHYIKQTYGCARVGARLTRFTLTHSESRLMRLGLLPLWLAMWARSNTYAGEVEYQGLRYSSLDVPEWCVRVGFIATAAGALAIVIALLSASLTNGTRPPALVVVPLLAMFVWWIPVTSGGAFLVLVPFFHSLQYLPFVVRIERSRMTTRTFDDRRHRGVAIAVVLIVAGWAAFELLPNIVDAGSGSADRVGFAYALVGAAVLINVHHYFIDHVIWRFDDDRVRADLLEG